MQNHRDRQLLLENEEVNIEMPSQGMHLLAEDINEKTPLISRIESSQEHVLSISELVLEIANKLPSSRDVNNFSSVNKTIHSFISSSIAAIHDKDGMVIKKGTYAALLPELKDNFIKIQTYEKNTEKLDGSRFLHKGPASVAIITAGTLGVFGASFGVGFAAKAIFDLTVSEALEISMLAMFVLAIPACISIILTGGLGRDNYKALEKEHKNTTSPTPLSLKL